MTDYLVSMSIGPVQEFIAAARRTADLFAGSALLTAVVGAAAASFPDPSEGPVGEDVAPNGRIFPTDPAWGGANKILAIVSDPQVAVREAKDAAQRALTDAWTSALREVPADQQVFMDLDRAGAQVGSFLEMYAAWVPVTAETYAEARIQVERLLAGRKALRDFEQQPADDAGIPNSPLDPSRPSVVTPAYMLQAPAGLRAHPLWLKPTEVLDGVSVLKRLRGRSLRDVLSTRDLAQRTVEPGFAKPDDDDFVPSYPYFAVLVADGDRMGALLNSLHSVKEHRQVSKDLDVFAAQAREIIELADGQCVYTGGDDVLALLPVSQAIECAQLLAETFAETLEGATLSVGIAIVHHRDPLSVSLSRARQAEREAKKERDSLAVALHTRAGSPLRISEPWPATRLSAWLSHARSGQVSRGLPHALRELAFSWPEVDAADALQGEVRRVLEHSQPRVQAKVLDQVPLLKDASDLHRFAELLVLARFLEGRNE